jgi:hypothetical protein
MSERPIGSTANSGRASECRFEQSMHSEAVDA